MIDTGCAARAANEIRSDFYVGFIARGILGRVNEYLKFKCYKNI